MRLERDHASLQPTVFQDTCQPGMGQTPPFCGSGEKRRAEVSEMWEKTLRNSTPATDVEFLYLAVEEERTDGEVSWRSALC